MLELGNGIFMNIYGFYMGYKSHIYGYDCFV